MSNRVHDHGMSIPLSGETSYRLSVLRNEAAELLDSLDSSDPEHEALQRRIEEIDREMQELG